MKIFGIGTDIVNIKRMKKTLKSKNNNFKKNKNVTKKQECVKELFHLLVKTIYKIENNILIFFNLF